MEIKVSPGLENIMGENPVRGRTFAKKLLVAFIPYFGDKQLLQCRRGMIEGWESERFSNKEDARRTANFVIGMAIAAKYTEYIGLATKAIEMFYN